MRLTKPAVLAALCLLLSAAAFAQGDCPPAGSLSFPVTLTGSQFGAQGSPTGFGTGFVTFNPANNTATVQLNTMGLGPNITSAALFSNGTSVLPLFTMNGSTGQSGQTAVFDRNGNFTTTVSLTPQLMNSILANPSAFSFNVATGEFPNGAISGTLMNTPTFNGTFSGTNLVGSTGATAGGGTFSATIVPNANGSGSTLFYSFMPTGIGNSFTSLSLNQGGIGAAGTPFVTLSNGGTLTNGRITGSAPLTSAQAQALLSNPAGFNVVANTSQFPNGAVRAQFGVAQNELWFPVAGSTRGALGNQWTTDLRIYNDSGTAPANVTIEIFPAGQNNTTTGGTMNALGASAVTIAAGATSAMTDITGILAQNFAGIGALRITSDQPVVAVERIYDANANAFNGNNIALAAQPIFGRTLCDAQARGLLIGVSSSVDRASALAVHSNIGFFNPNPAAVTVQVNVGSSQGTSLGAMQSLVLQPYQLMQMPLVSSGSSNGLINSGSDITDAVVRYQSSAPIFAYSSTVNNASGDTHVTFSRPDRSAPATAQSDIAAIVLASNQAEVQEGQLAAANASAAAVRQFAQQMVTDHTNALSQAQAAFAALGITPSTTNASAQFLLNQTQQQLQGLQQAGASFDRTYMQTQVNAHQTLLQFFDTILIPSASGSTQLTTLLQQMRATTAQHLAMAQTILSQLP